jgi:hypothetical protein
VKDSVLVLKDMSLEFWSPLLREGKVQCQSFRAVLT